MVKRKLGHVILIAVEASRVPGPASTNDNESAVIITNTVITFSKSPKSGWRAIEVNFLPAIKYNGLFQKLKFTELF